MQIFLWSKLQIYKTLNLDICSFLMSTFEFYKRKPCEREKWAEVKEVLRKRNLAWHNDVIKFYLFNITDFVWFSLIVTAKHPNNFTVHQNDGFTWQRILLEKYIHIVLRVFIQSITSNIHMYASAWIYYKDIRYYNCTIGNNIMTNQLYSSVILIKYINEDKFSVKMIIIYLIKS